MAERTYTAQRFDVVDGPAEPGYGWGFHATCQEVRLTVRDDATFRLQLGSFYSDWGERNQDLVLYEGSCEEQPEGFICRATSRAVDDYFYDHELGDKRKNQKREPCEQRFDFHKRSDAELVCPVDHGNLAGVVMSLHVTPMRNLKKHG